MEGNSPYITNLVNSIIGVSVLAMPFCLKKCGIILGLGLLFCAAWLTYLSCSMLASSAFHKRRRTYEYLALNTLGPTGKFAVELSMIGMMLGTCVAFYVVIGDLSNGILSKFIESADPHTLRIFTIVFCALCIALPLGMMKNLAVLSYFGFFSLMFYLAFLVVVILNAVSNGLLRLEWWNEVNLFRPAGIFQCLPIFSLAYACQCQLFIVYSSLEDPSVRRIEEIVSGAIKFVTIVYMSVGFFGYTTYREKIAGNLLVSFPSNLLLDFIKLGFAMSIVLGFPLMISPCRQSIHTLFFAKPAAEGLQPQTYIPPFLFKSITLTIVLSTMTIAIVIPNVETILGLTGATMGSIICFIFPALIYEKAAPKAPGAVSKFVFCLGCVLLVMCTYSNLANTGGNTEPENPIVPMDQKPPEVDLHEIDNNPGNVENENKVEGKEEKPDPVEDKDKPNNVAEFVDHEHRHEPANPVDTEDEDAKEPEDANQVDEPPKEEDEKEKLADADDKEVVKQDNDDPEVLPAPKELEKPQDVEGKEEEKNDDPKLSKPKESPELKVEDQVQAKESPGLKEDEKVADPAAKVPEKQPDISPKKEVDVEPHRHPSAVNISPKLIQKNELHNENAERELKERDVHHPQAGMSHKAGDVQGNQQDHIQQPNPVPDVKNPETDEKPAAHDSPEEKELLEKIKIQYDKQQELLKEQGQLIKKLEEHQDKKEQAVEEKHVDPLKSKEEVRAERDVHPLMSDNIAAEKDSVDVALPPKDDFLGEFKGLDTKVEIPGGKVLAGDGILPGRELLSKENKLGLREPKMEDNLGVVSKEEEKLPPNQVSDNDEKVELGNEGALSDSAIQELKPKEDTLGSETGQLSSELNLRRAERSVQDAVVDLFEGHGNAQSPDSQKLHLAEDGDTLNLLDTVPPGLDLEAKNHQGQFQQDIEKIPAEDPHEDIEDIERGEQEAEDGKRVDSVQDVEMPSKFDFGQSNDEAEVDGRGIIAVDCEDDDLKCWQGKSKSRELKSLQDDP